ncbi:hypothetical protein HHI36_009455 [Cryptolaemus montrouzieri]|uniref:Uncharacterized protein n=1 Tax=Cryptolaemus montrouzieri TaxID=559131 RepID=A0ABD2MGJ0_9CUCU
MNRETRFKEHLSSDNISPICEHIKKHLITLDNNKILQNCDKKRKYQLECLEINILCKNPSKSPSIRRIKTVVEEQEPLITYYVYFHSIATHRINLSFQKFCGVLNLRLYGCESYCKYGTNKHCESFKSFRILTIPCCYIEPCLTHSHENKENRQTHSAQHKYSTRARENCATKKTPTTNTKILRLHKYENVQRTPTSSKVSQ